MVLWYFLWSIEYPKCENNYKATEGPDRYLENTHQGRSQRRHPKNTRKEKIKIWLIWRYDTTSIYCVGVGQLIRKIASWKGCFLLDTGTPGISIQINFKSSKNKGEVQLSQSNWNVY